MTPATAYDIHAEEDEVGVSIEQVFFHEAAKGGDSLVQFVPGRSAMLSTMRMAPGVWMHIMGMLSAPTSLRPHVCAIWGAYCNAARSAEETPRKVAQSSSWRERWASSGVGLVESSRKVTKVMSALHGETVGSAAWRWGKVLDV